MTRSEMNQIIENARKKARIQGDLSRKRDNWFPMVKSVT